MMKQIAYIFLFLSLSVFHGFGQQIEFNTNSFYGIWSNEKGGYYYSGGGFDLIYAHPLAKGELRSGIDFRNIDWGNQLTLNIGYTAPYISKDKWQLNGITSTGLGMALFHDNSLFVLSVGYMPEISWRNDKKFSWSIGLGVRYTTSPAYKNYGTINQVLDFPYHHRIHRIDRVCLCRPVLWRRIRPPSG